MSARAGFTASDAERQTADAAENYLNRALRRLADRLNLEKSLQHDPAAFAAQFAPLVSALIEAQAREYQSWVFYDRLESLANASERGLSDLAGMFDKRLESLDESLLSGLADLAEHWEEMNAGTCRSCARKAGAAYWQARREAREAAGDGERGQA
jgi:hypothetical protein